METYVTVAFWMGVVGVVINTSVMAVVEWPRTHKESLGAMVAKTLLGAGFTIWAGMVLYAR